MPIEREILAAGALDPDDPQVRAALHKLSRTVQNIVTELVVADRRAAAEEPPEQPPPEHEKGPAPRPESAGPNPRSTVSTPRPKGEEADAYF